MKKKIAKTENCSFGQYLRNIREKEKQKYVSKCIFSCLQEIKMHRSTRNFKKMLKNLKIELYEILELNKMSIFFLFSDKI